MSRAGVKTCPIFISSYITPVSAKSATARHNQKMSWSIQSISPSKESVFLEQTGTGVTRQISVPGATDAFFEGGMLMIKASTGCVWEVDPNTGSRKRLCNEEAQ